MADKLFPIGDGSSFKRFKDMGDGTFAEVVSVSGGGGAGTVSGIPSPGNVVTPNIPAGATYTSLQWIRILNGVSTDIAGQTSAAGYTIVNGDIGYQISFRLIGYNPAASGMSIPAIAPVALTAPAIAGTPTVGTPLSITAGTFSGAPTPTVARFIYANSQLVASVASTGSYTPVAGNVGAVFTVDDVATNSGGVAHNMSQNSAACVAAPTGLYMIASNRFMVNTDWGITDTGFAAGDTTGRSGGNGTILCRYFRRRYKFSTTWAASEGRFLWANAANTLGGMLDSLFQMTYLRCEVRDTSLALIDTVKWAGANTKVMAVGEKIFSDPIATLAANTTYYLDLWYTVPDGAGVPASAPFLLQGEVSGESLTDISLAAMPTTGGGSAVGGHHGPCGFYAKGWDGSPVAMLFGDSILDFTNVSAQLATTRGDLGHIQMALGDPANGGSWNYNSTARYSSSFGSIYTDGQTAGAKGVIDWLADALAVLQSAPPFNVVLCEHGRNSLGAASTLSSMKTFATGAYAKMRTRWGSDLKIFQTTTCPYTKPLTGGNQFMFGSDEANQEPITASNSDGAGGVIHFWNDWIVAGADGTLTGGIDAAGPCRGVAYDKWANRGFSTVMLDAVTAANTNIVRLQDAPLLGESLVFEPGVTNSDGSSSAKTYTVAAITANGGGGFDCVLNGGRLSRFAPSSAGLASRVVKAHAAGSTVVSSYSVDYLHPGHYAQMLMRDVVKAAKPAILASLS